MIFFRTTHPNTGTESAFNESFATNKISPLKIQGVPQYTLPRTTKASTVQSPERSVELVATDAPSPSDTLMALLEWLQSVIPIDISDKGLLEGGDIAISFLTMAEKILP